MAGIVVLVTGATGIQGGSTVRELVKLNATIHALVRTPTSPAAAELSQLGVKLFPGDFDDRTTISAALQGVTAVFLNVSPSLTDVDAEVRHARNVVDAAKLSGTVDTIVYPSIILTGQQRTFPGWHDWNNFTRQYWLGKAQNEELIRSAGIRHWTILRPCTFMSNYLAPFAPFLFPGLLSQHIFRTALTPTTRTMLISPDDIGKFAAAALTDPENYHGHEIELGSEALTPDEIAAALTKASGKEIEVQYIAPNEAKELAKTDHVIATQLFFNEWSSRMDTQALRSRYGIPLATFAEYLSTHEDKAKASFG